VVGYGAALYDRVEHKGKARHMLKKGTKVLVRAPWLTEWLEAEVTGDHEVKILSGSLKGSTMRGDIEVAVAR